jgi:hypothetical protein
MVVTSRTADVFFHRNTALAAMHQVPVEAADVAIGTRLDGVLTTGLISDLALSVRGC